MLCIEHYIKLYGLFPVIYDIVVILSGVPRERDEVEGPAVAFVRETGPSLSMAIQ
jgi:hypothetical protein